MPERRAGEGETPGRKSEHLAISTSHDVESAVAPGWDDVVLVHRCLPEVDHDEIDTSTSLLGRPLHAPLVIAAITGGNKDAAEINRRLARAAHHFGLAMGVGSQRPYLESEDTDHSYVVVREEAPDALLIANVGAPQLIPQRGKRAYTPADVRRAVDLIGAGALAVHLNFLQEAVQPEGDTMSRGCAEAIGRLAGEIGVPVIAKETGAGISREQAKLLKRLGVAAFDVGGAGGTSMPLVEAHRSAARGDVTGEAIGRLFANWGIPAAASVLECTDTGLPVIATGGIRSGMDAARALALGATAAGVALPLLKAAAESYEKLEEWLERFLAELRTAMFLVGARTIDDLRVREKVILGRTLEWSRQRGLLRRANLRSPVN